VTSYSTSFSGEAFPSPITGDIRYTTSLRVCEERSKESEKILQPKENKNSAGT
jgi:hypothetical protein